MYIDKDNQELMLKLTSKIECTYSNQTPKQATCFFYGTANNKIILVTNKHVFKDALTAQLYLTAKDATTGDVKNYDVTIPLTDSSVKFHQDYDIGTFDFTESYNSLQKKNLIPEITTLKEIGIFTDYDSLDIVQEIIMLGYPDGTINATINNPVVRTGVTATAIKYKYNGKNLFLTDIPTFGGSSGSPILIATKEGKLRLVGVNSQTRFHQAAVYDDKHGKKDRNVVGYVEIPNSIGIAVNSVVVKEMLDMY